jgi:hypothetical protein
MEDRTAEENAASEIGDGYEVPLDPMDGLACESCQ